MRKQWAEKRFIFTDETNINKPAFRGGKLNKKAMKTHYRNYSVICINTKKELKRKSIEQIHIEEFKKNSYKEFGSNICFKLNYCYS